MYKRYFRKENPQCCPEETQWIEMTGKEFYQFVRSPEGQGRYFIDMDDVVLEVTEMEARSYKSEQNHRYYMQTQENDWSTLSLYAIEDESGCSGEEVVPDEMQAVEDEAILRIERRTLRIALEHLDAESYRLIDALDRA